MTMNYQHIKLELPELTDESAAALQNFIYALMYAVDEQYYKPKKSSCPENPRLFFQVSAA